MYITFPISHFELFSIKQLWYDKDDDLMIL